MWHKWNVIRSLCHVIAFHQIESSDGIVRLMALHINVHALYYDSQLYHDRSWVQTQRSALLGEVPSPHPRVDQRHVREYW